MNVNVQRSLVSPEGQKVTWVELFFDLVFVFSVTQIVGLFHDGIDLRATGQAVLTFWLVWWAWTQFTWALNAADTTHHRVELATLVATAVAFFMGVAVPQAFVGHAAWFAVPYVLVRAIGLAIYARVAEAKPAQHAAVRKFALVSVGGLLAVLIGGFTSGAATYTFWSLAILLDIIAAAIGGQSEHWDLQPEHFAERHGLFVIIALGETLIVAATGMEGDTWTRSALAVATLSVAITCSLWWTHFTRAKLELDEALETARGSARSEMARDAFSLLHFPMLCGIIAYAAALEHALAHPTEPFAIQTRLALALGLTLFVGGMSVSLWRCTRRINYRRLFIIGATALAIVAVAGAPPVVTLFIALLGVSAVAASEHERHLSPSPH
jgi:low temperature requirement protein LtrA